MPPEAGAAPVARSAAPVAGPRAFAPSVDVALTPADVAPTAVAVVIDVLRATSTVVQALAVGYRRVLCAEGVERARELRGPGRVLAGERGGLAPPGFDLGNSPRSLRPASGEELVLATTNGSPAIVRAASMCDEVLLGALVNRDAVTRAIPSGQDVVLVCSGTDGRLGLEDAYLAGTLSAALGGTRSDAAVAAERIAGSYASAIEALRASANARALERVGLGADVEWCAQDSTLDLVPRVEKVRDAVAVVY